jgi:hypothetical protein
LLIATGWKMSCAKFRINAPLLHLARRHAT